MKHFSASLLSRSGLGSFKQANGSDPYLAHLDSPKYFGRDGSVVKGDMLLRAARTHGISPRLLAAIVANESGWGTHPNAVKANNFSGIMGSGSELYRYKTPQDGLNAAASLLKRRYVDRGLDTPETIGPVYAPTVNATNDPNGINNNWIPTVNSIMKRIPTPAGSNQPVLVKGKPPAGVPVQVKGTPPPGAEILPPLTSSVKTPAPDTLGSQPLSKPPLLPGKSASAPESWDTPSKSAALSVTGVVALHRARETTDKKPTEGQIAAGNYRKGRVTLRRLPIAIENPIGEERCGKSSNGKTWKRIMHRDYGYFVGTSAIDGDPVDVFIGDDPEEGRIWVIDQVNSDGSYDEPKVVLGMPDEQSARDLYLKHYPDGWTGIGAITEMGEDKFRRWLADKPSGQVAAKLKEAGTLPDWVHGAANFFLDPWRGAAKDMRAATGTSGIRSPGYRPFGVLHPENREQPAPPVRQPIPAKPVEVDPEKKAPVPAPSAIRPPVALSNMKSAKLTDDEYDAYLNGGGMGAVRDHRAQVEANKGMWERAGGLKGIGGSVAEGVGDIVGWKPDDAVSSVTNVATNFTPLGLVRGGVNLLGRAATGWANNWRDRKYWGKKIMTGVSDESLRRSQEYQHPTTLGDRPGGFWNDVAHGLGGSTARAWAPVFGKTTPVNEPVKLKRQWGDKQANALPDWAVDNFDVDVSPDAFTKLPVSYMTDPRVMTEQQLRSLGSAFEAGDTGWTPGDSRATRLNNTIYELTRLGDSQFAHLPLALDAASSFASGIRGKDLPGPLATWTGRRNYGGNTFDGSRWWHPLASAGLGLQHAFRPYWEQIRNVLGK